jgi:hypothetical protein
MLALKDDRHEVRASVPGLAKVAGISVTQCKEGLGALMLPDPDSRTPDFEGRRIEKVDGGWVILNGEKFRARRSLEERREYKAEWMRNHRSRQARTPVDNVDRTEQNITEQNKEDHKARTKISFSPEGDFLGITKEKIEKWKDAYPAIDVLGEIKKAAIWLTENPKNKKKNYGRFLTNWFARKQEKAPGRGNGNGRAQECWSELLAYVKRHGSRGGCTLTLPKEAKDALKACGGLRAIGDSTDFTVSQVKAKFIDAYQ